jgi:hypothetical protein
MNGQQSDIFIFSSLVYDAPAAVQLPHEKEMII